MTLARLSLTLPLVALLAACQTGSPGASTATGGLAGAALGAAVASPDDRVKGAIIGGATGALIGNVIGQNSAGQCIYRLPDGRQYTAAC